MSDLIGKLEAYMIMCDVLEVLSEKEAIKKTVYERLKQVPSADAGQGEWIITKEGEYDGRSVYKTVCSECGHETFYKANKAHFCHNCGARMFREDGEE